MDDEFSYLDDPVWQFALYEFINEDEEVDEETNTIEINLEITIDIAVRRTLIPCSNQPQANNRMSLAQKLLTTKL